MEEREIRRQENLADQFAATQSLVAEITSLCRRSLRQVTVGQFECAPQRVVLRVCLLRQHEALLVGLDSMDRGLLHYAAAQVRPACDELIWLTYLGSLSAPQQFDAVVYLAGEEMGRALTAEASFIGPEGMKEAGYPPDLIDGVGASVAAKSRLRSLQKTLGWPAGKRPPTTAWVAQRTEHAKLYDYIFSATSRFLHFSASESMRRGWASGPGVPDIHAEINLHAPEYGHYRADFALYWLANMYLLTARTAIAMDGSYEVAQPTDLDDTKFQEALRRWKSVVGRISIVRPDEFRVPPGFRGR